MRIALDCDGVLADFVGALCKGLPGRKPEDFTCYDIFQVLNASEAVRVRGWMNEPGFWSSIPWYPGGRVFISALQEKGEVRVYTAPSSCPTWDFERRNWLHPYVNRARVISVSSNEKALVASNNDVLIEDRTETALEWLRHSRGIAVLMSRPWNRHAPHHPRLYRADNYVEAMRCLTDSRITLNA